LSEERVNFETGIVKKAGSDIMIEELAKTEALVQLIFNFAYN